MKRLLIGMICWLLAGLHGAGAAIAAEGPDARILIDVSGSMKGTDPDNLRRPALRLLVGLLPTGARAGVWTFAEQTQPFAALGQVNDAWRTQALAKAGQIHSRGQFTHIEEAINRASADWRGPAAGSGVRHWRQGQGRCRSSAAPHESGAPDRPRQALVRGAFCMAGNPSLEAPFR